MVVGTPLRHRLEARIGQIILDVQIARDFRDRLFEPDASCVGCGTTDTWLLVLGRSRPICYGCDAKRRGLSGFELHHIGGCEGIPVRLSANRHRQHELYQDVVEQLGLDAGSRLLLELVLFVALELQLGRGAPS